MHGMTNHKSARFILKIMSNYDIALEVLSGKWGNGAERRERLTAAGYDYNAVQSIVNALLQDKDKPSAPTPEILEIDYDPERYKGIQVNIII